MLKKCSLQFWFRVSLATIIAIFCIYQMNLLGPFIISLILTLLLWPIVNMIEDFVRERCKVSWFTRWMAIIPTFIVFGGLLAVIFNYIFLPFVVEFSKLLQNIPFLIKRLIAIITYIQVDFLNQDMPDQILKVINETFVRVGNYGVDLVEEIVAGAMHVARVAIDLLLVPIITFYLLKDGRYFIRQIQGIFSDSYANHLARVSRKVYLVLGGYVRAEMVLAINMFIIVMIAMTAFGVSYPLVLALIAAVAEWIPIVGPIVAAFFAIAMASAISLQLALKVALFYLIMQLIDGQIIKPKVFGSYFHLHPIVIIAVVFVFGSLYGVVGMILAVPGTALAQIIAKEMWYYNLIYKGEKNENNE